MTIGIAISTSLLLVAHAVKLTCMNELVGDSSLNIWSKIKHNTFSIDKTVPILAAKTAAGGNMCNLAILKKTLYLTIPD